MKTELETLRTHLAAEAAHDAVAAAACYVADGWYHHAALGFRFDGRDGVAAQYALSYESFPDLAFNVEEEIIGEGAVAQFGRFEGTLTGDLLGLPATGASVSLPMVARYRFRDGLIESEEITFDLANFADQAGIDFATLQGAAGIDTAAQRAGAAVTRYATAKSRADIEGALAECTPGFVLHTVAFRMTSTGQDDAHAGLGLWFTAFPDYAVAADGQIATESAVTCWGTISATMAGALGPVAATGRRYEMPFSCVFAIEAGKIAREDFHFDLARMTEQLGIDSHALIAVLPPA